MQSWEAFGSTDCWAALMSLQKQMQVCHGALGNSSMAKEGSEPSLGERELLCNSTRVASPAFIAT